VPAPTGSTANNVKTQQAPALLPFPPSKAADDKPSLATELMAKARRASKEVVAVARDAAADARSMFGKEGRAARRAAKRAAKAAAAAQQVLAKEVVGGRQSAAKQAMARSSASAKARVQAFGRTAIRRITGDHRVARVPAA
jgi:hypothetical protein